MTQNRGSKETFHRLSPKQTMLASGTTNAEHGVFFKWRHSTQIALEGSREVTIRFLVPHDWRGDWLEFQAEMLGRHRNYLGEKVEPVGQAQVFLALYRMGDGAAQQAALVVAAAQSGAAAGRWSYRTGVCTGAHGLQTGRSGRAAQIAGVVSLAVDVQAVQSRAAGCR